MSDWELLQTYVKNRSDAAFAELVRRHLNWVYSAALRQTHDPHLAEDVTQAVFVLLARKAGDLRPGTILGGWLFRTTRFVASRALRTEYRRKAREQTAVAMSPITTSSDENENLWSQLTPHLDQAVAALSETDRAAILLRFYEKKPLHEVGQQLGLSDDAAKKRVTRAVEKMRSFLTSRGVVLGGAGLIAVLAEQTVHAAPANLALGVVKAAMTGFSASATLPQLARETLQAWHLAKLKLVAGIAVISITGIVIAISLASRQEPGPVREPVVEKSIAASVPTNDTMIRTRIDTRAANETASNRFINIQVVQARTKQPLPDTEIRFSREKKKIVGHTDKQGLYQLELPDKDPAYLSVTARKDGFVPMTAAWRAQSETFALPREFTFALDLSVPIGGVIQNKQGQPIPNATVFLMQSTPSRDKVAQVVHGYIQTVEPSVNSKVVTDAQGRWRYDGAGADASKMYFRLVHPDYVSTPMFSDALTPRPEKLHDLTSVMVMEKGLSVDGTVLDTTGRPIRGAKVMQGHDRWGSNYPDTMTDAEGRFHFANAAPGEMILTIQAEGHVPELDTVQVNDHTEPLEFRLAAGGTIRIRVVDPVGKPIAGAFVAADTWHKHRSLEWKTETDVEGRSVWTNAPPDEVKFEVGKAGFLSRYDVDRMPSFKPSGIEQVVTLLPAQRIRGTVVDADTGQPIPSFKVTPGNASKDSDEPYWDYYRAATFTDGRYETPLESERDTLLLRIEAEGYQATNSGAFAAVGSDVTLDFQLQKRNWPSGIVRTPDGQPVANADVFLTTSSLYVQNTRPMPGMAEDKKIRTRADGSFKLPLPEKPFLLIATADSGFAEIHSETANFPADITLQPWGRVEGTFSIGLKPTAGQKITLNPDYRFVSTKDPSVQYQTEGVETDRNGHFAFERIRPGEMIIEPTYALVVIKSGETTSVILGGTGRPVTGRVMLPTGETNAFNGSNTVGFLEFKQLGEADVIRLAAEEKVAPAVVEDRLRQWHESEAGRAYRQARRIYRLNITSEGTFRVNEVPAGTYNLHIEYNQPPVFNDQYFLIRQYQRIGWLDTDVVIPEIPGGHTDEPLDLGVVELKPVSKQ